MLTRYEHTLNSLNKSKAPSIWGLFYFPITFSDPFRIGRTQSPNHAFGVLRITFSDPFRIGRTQSPNHAFGVLRITFSDPFRIGRTQSPNHAFGVCGLFYLFAFESKLSTLINKKALNTSC